ncbi:hypothetical protein Q9L58_002172 [Maublancomyces gigas]|uniref:Uncharacterized protein n=1 Tax=Discina gigas TaxID=1032678 RepID=A0ABR3GSB8_9PEZI
MFGSVATTASVFVMLLATIVHGAGWHMDINYADGVTTKIHGHTNSGCTKFKKTNTDINSVYFDTSLLADTFVLYSDENCKSEVYKGKKGNNNVPNDVYGSYKVY